MFNKRSLISSALLGSLIAIAGSGMAAMQHAAPAVTANATRKTKRALFGGVIPTNIREYNYRGAGVTMAQQQRNSRKARNVKRHKSLAHR